MQDDQRSLVGVRDAPPAGFAAALFGHVAQEDLRAYDAKTLAMLAESAWRHLCARRERDRPDIRLLDPAPGNGSLAEMTVLEVVNDDMPFLLDSTLGELAELGLELRLVAHPVFSVQRDDEGRLIDIRLDHSAPPPGFRHESLIHIHLDRIAGEVSRSALERALETTYGEVRLVAADRAAMMEQGDACARALQNNPPPLAVDEIAEAIQFLDWLLADNFVFLGQRQYRFEQTGEEGSATFSSISDSGLGILRDPDVRVLRRGREFVAATPEVLEFMRDRHVLIVAKANVRSRVHRRVHMDYVGVKQFDAAGRPAGEIRIIGLFTASAYTQSTHLIPYVRHKVARALENSDVDIESHSGRVLAAALETYPRDELFQVDVATLTRLATAVAALQERPRLRVLTRIDRFDRFVSVLAFLPRDRFDTRVQIKLGQELARIYQGRVSATYPSFPEGPLVRIHYIVGRYEGPTPNPPRESVEAAAAAVVRTWSDGLRALIIASPDAGGHDRAARWSSAFSAGYMEAFGAAQALRDIELVQNLSEDSPCAVALRPNEHAGDRADFEVFSYGRPMPLSERVPALEAMGFRVVSERTFEIEETGGSQRIWLHDMALMRSSGAPIDIETRGALIEAAAMAVFTGEAESDGYNALALEAALNWREIALLRALSRYLRQIGVTWSQSYMWQALERNGAVAERLIALFSMRFDPRRALDEEERTRGETDIASEIEALLRQVASLDEDRILRRFLNLVQAATRTNFFQTSAKETSRRALAIKFDSRRIDDLALPRPLCEITVYSPRVEGIHLRFGKIARGGLRWSDRPQDFRTEILGLAKAQQVKNAVIVPVGAKGGFVPKQLPPASRREAYLAEGVGAYRLFVNALLDVTDNLSGESIVAPADTVRRDGDDPYFVVAADKGTATFSDIANDLAMARGFWLDDAFASGGSAGYDHKKMGITARGAWEAVKRHFRELDVDIQTTPFTVIGVGDMSGDVFGNGMLLSRATKLLAAFDHRDIFLDPDPDPAIAFEERERLFRTPGSSWQDYDHARISSGGGVYSRAAKSAPLSPQVQSMLGLYQDEATPDAILCALLAAPVDLLWFGGIGTYVRASDESNEQAGDRGNDSIRIAAADLRCRAIGEGANLALTQKARIEAARRGLRLNTDAIDNSAGVNTSDIEVNIKIALAQPLRAGALDRSERDRLLAQMTDEVASLVLRNNYQQTLAISLAERQGAGAVGSAIRLMQQLEAQGRLDRAVEFLPSDGALMQRTKSDAGLTRPEIAVLLAYAKLMLHDELLASGVPDDPCLACELTGYFPSVLRERFPDAIATHRLRRNIVATQLANEFVDRAGPTSIASLADETGAPRSEVARAFVIARDAFSLTELNKDIDALDARIAGATQLTLYAEVQSLLLSRVSWFARNVGMNEALAAIVERFRTGVVLVGGALDQTIPDRLRTSIADHAARLEQADAPAELAGRIARLGALAFACDVVLIADETKRPAPDVASAFFALDETFGVSDIAEAARRIPAADYYERLALDRTIDNLEQSLRRLTGNVVRGSDKSGAAAAAAWIEERGTGAARVRLALSDLAAGGLTLPKAIVAGGLLAELIGE